MTTLKVKLTFVEPILGTSPANEDIYREFIASKAEDAATIEDEVAALGAEAVAEKGMTVFPRMEDGTPFPVRLSDQGLLQGYLRRPAQGQGLCFCRYQGIQEGDRQADFPRTPVHPFRQLLRDRRLSASPESANRTGRTCFPGNV